MFSPDGYLGRLGFVGGLTVVNTAGALVSLAILFAGVLGSSVLGTGGLVLLGLFAGVMWCWYCLHARRYADAGLPRGVPRAMALVLGGGFLACFFVLLSLGGAPGGSVDPFRTGGAIATGRELIPAPFTQIGQWMVGALGVATAVAIGTAAVIGAGLLGAASLVFSLATALKPPKRIWVGPAPGGLPRGVAPMPSGVAQPDGRRASGLPPGVTR